MRIFSILIVFLFLAVSALAETDCPFGLVNDPAPGTCARYIDTNGNSLCDLSEVPLEKDFGAADKSGITYLPEAEIKEKTVKEMAETYGIETGTYRAALSDLLKIEVKGGDSLLFLHDNYGAIGEKKFNYALNP